MRIWHDRRLGSPCARVVSVATLVSLMFFSSACLGTEPTRESNDPVRQIAVRPDQANIRVGNALTMQATAYGDIGQTLSGKTFTWASSNTAIATVSSTGIVTGVAVGSARIAASAEGISANANVEILAAAPRDFSIVDAQFTQGVQAPDGSIPMVRGGNAAVVNVMLAANETQTASRMQVVLRLFNANDAIIRVDTAMTGTLFEPLPSTAAPSAQFLIPASVIQPGMRWQVERDPRHVITDSDAADDVYPRTGLAALNVTDVPPLSLRFVPITLAVHGSSAQISGSAMPDFTRTLESVMPVGAITRTIASPFSTQSNFGTMPRGGDGPFWTQLLGELDLARLLDTTDRFAYWIGVVIPPPGFNFSIFGGFGFIPATGLSTGAGSRTTVLVGPGWFSAPTAGRDGVAHELGHNFGRRHAPCGLVGTGIDPAFPDPAGAIGIAGHDVYAWAKGLAASASVIGGGTGDVMGYCTRPWASPYTYDGALRFRRAGITTAINMQAQPERVMIVRGSVINGNSAVLEPAFTATAMPTEPDPIGPYRLEGLDAMGHVLFARSFATAVIDHAPGVGQFTFAIPVSGVSEDQLTTLRVIVPGRPSTVRQSTVANSAARSAANTIAVAASPPASVTLNANGLASATCHAPYTAGILVQHRGTGLLATNSTSTVTFAATNGMPLDIQCSDGVRSITYSAIAP